MSTGLGLIHRLLLERQDLSVLRESEIDVTFFGKEEKKVYRFVENHFLNYNTLPQIETVERENDIKFPQFQDEPLGYWIEEVRKRHKVNLISAATKELKALALSGELDEADKVVRRLVVDMEKGSKGSRVVAMSDIAPRILEAHKQRQKSMVIKGVPFGIPYLDWISDGAQPTDTVALAGRPSAGKSFFVLSMASNSYDALEIPLFVTLEMSPEQCTRRILALRSHVSSTQARLGRLSYWAEQKLYKEIQTIQKAGRPFHILHGRLDTTVEDLFIRVRELRPTVLYVDGAYLLRSRTRTASRWERVAETAEFLKMIAAEFNIPVIATYQFSRKGKGLGEIAYSDSIAQLASIVIGLEDFEKQSETSAQFNSGLQQYKKLTLLKGREGEKGVIKVLYDMEHTIIKEVEVIKGQTQEEEESDE